jgi:hypothetical protein
MPRPTRVVTVVAFALIVSGCDSTPPTTSTPELTLKPDGSATLAIDPNNPLVINGSKTVSKQAATLGDTADALFAGIKDSPVINKPTLTLPVEVADQLKKSQSPLLLGGADAPLQLSPTGAASLDLANLQKQIADGRAELDEINKQKAETTAFLELAPAKVKALREALGVTDRDKIRDTVLTALVTALVSGPLWTWLLWLAGWRKGGQ